MANHELKVKIALRNDTKENWTKLDPILLKGEIGIEADTQKLKIGDGASKWSELTYFGGDVADLLTKYLDKETYAGSKVGYVKAADTADKLTTARTINGVAFDGTKNITIADNTKIPTSQKGVAGGVAILDESGLIPSNQLPSYVDDVIEGYFYQGKFYKESTHGSEIKAESGKIYIDITVGVDVNKCQYRWSGTAYVSISNPLDIATTEEAKAGANDTKAMTPKKTKEAIEARGYITKTEVQSGYEPKIQTKGTAFNKDFGTTAGTVTEGNDPRLSDARVPKGNAGGDLTGSYPNPVIAAGKVTDEKIAANALSTSKLFTPSGDTLVLNGGNAQG